MRRAEKVRVSTKGQIVLPKRYRDVMGIREGDYVSVYEVDDGILILEKVRPSPLEALTESLRREARTRKVTREQLQAAIKAARAGRRPDAD